MPLPPMDDIEPHWPLVEELVAINLRYRDRSLTEEEAKEQAKYRVKALRGEEPMHPPMDSTGQPVHVGDRVRWRGREFTIKSFGPAIGTHGTRIIEFDKPPHHDEVPDEISIDLIERGSVVSFPEKTK